MRAGRRRRPRRVPQTATPAPLLRALGTLLLLAAAGLFG